MRNLITLWSYGTSQPPVILLLKINLKTVAVIRQSQKNKMNLIQPYQIISNLAKTVMGHHDAMRSHCNKE